jgi:hypothetical protein
MKLVTNTQMTLDGVVQGNGGRNENRSGGFERGGWAWALTDSEGRKWRVSPDVMEVIIQKLN